MKITTSLIVSLFLILSLNAQINSTTNIDTTEIVYENINDYDLLKLKQGLFTSEIGAPKLPVVDLYFILPENTKVTNVVITDTSKVTLPGTYNISVVSD